MQSESGFHDDISLDIRESKLQEERSGIDIFANESVIAKRTFPTESRTRLEGG